MTRLFTVIIFSSFIFIESNTPYKWKKDFEGDWTKEWGLKDDKKWGMENLKVLKEKNNYFLRAYFPKGSASPNVTSFSGAPIGGGQFLNYLGKFDSLYFSYTVRFKENFQYNKGGKLPGLYGGAANSGGNIPTGYDGFSTRFMWRQEGIGELYAYLPSSKQWGTQIASAKWTFPDGTWHTIQHQVKLNDPDKSNGIIKVWIDGYLMHEERDLLFRKTDSLKINGIFFSTFFGGNDTTWASPEDTYIDFDDFVVSEKYID
ncbi:MAG: polysaccharide lyase [Cytophagaceae bacterium]